MQEATLFRQRLSEPETPMSRVIGGNMATFLEDSKFFWTEYHSGKVNVILHLVSFPFPVLRIERKECGSRPYGPFPLR